MQSPGNAQQPSCCVRCSTGQLAGESCCQEGGRCSLDTGGEHDCRCLLECKYAAVTGCEHAQQLADAASSSLQERAAANTAATAALSPDASATATQVRSSIRGSCLSPLHLQQAMSLPSSLAVARGAGLGSLQERAAAKKAAAAALEVSATAAQVRSCIRDFYLFSLHWQQAMSLPSSLAVGKKSSVVQQSS